MIFDIKFTFAQKSIAYDIGYALGYYGRMVLPFLLLAVVGYLLYRFIRKRKNS